MAYRVGIVGASGYGGAELLRLLAGHPDLDAAVVAAHSQAGERVDDLFPNLSGPGTFDAVHVETLAALDLVFLATPDDVALDIAPMLLDTTRVVDLSAAFRTPADIYARFYGRDHPRPDLTPAVYGLTEWSRDAVVAAGLVANPGCYVTTALLSLLPLTSLIDLDTLVIDGKSGTSGAGRAAKETLHFAHVAGSITAYGTPGHRHTGEIETYLQRLGGAPATPITFTPHLVPMPRGLLTTSVARLRPGVGPADVQAALHDRYAGEPFVTVLAPGNQPVTKSVAGSNGCQIAAVVDERTGRVTVTAVTDNLGKGAAGQALQNANLMLGLPETAGLTAFGVYP